MKNTWVIALVIVLILVGGYLGRHKIKALIGGSTQTPAQTQSTPSTPTTTASGSGAAISGGIITTKAGPKGNYLADSKGMTLYMFDKDSVGVSNCSGGCAKVWPPYVVSGAAPASLPSDVTTLKRADGSMQYAYKGMPLYYYASDTNPGDITGDGVGGVWHLVKP